MGKRMQKLREWMIEYAYLVTVGAVIAVIVGSAVYTRQLQSGQEIQAAAPAPETLASASPAPAAEPTPLPTLAPLATRPLSLGAQAAWPVDGEIVRGFDAQEMVWWERLGVWRAHTGVDVAAQAGQRVKAVAEGEVISCGHDALWGWRVAIRQADGHILTYAGLEGSLVQAGECVTCGQVIGTLMARVPVEGEMEAHLHLESEKNGVMQDPEAVLPMDEKAVADGKE